MLDLVDGEIEYDGVLFAVNLDRSPIILSSFDDGGIPGRNTQDAPIPSGDGVRFGVDTLGGRTYTITADAPDFDTADEIINKWLGDAQRFTPGVVAPLRMKRPGRETVRVYGRPRRAAPGYDDAYRRNIGIVVDFATADHRYYADVESGVVVPIVVPTTGGVSIPTTLPAVFSGETQTVRTVDVGGKLSTWMKPTIYGPVTKPKVELLDRNGGVIWSADFPSLTLAYDQSVTIDPYPWAGTVLRNDGASMAGKMSRSSTPLDAMTVSPGSWQVRFTGVDDTGTANCAFAWRNAWASM